MAETDLNICKSIKSLAILKFIIKSINIDDLDNKLIFVGNHNDNIKLILTKLLKLNRIKDIGHGPTMNSRWDAEVWIGKVPEMSVYSLSDGGAAGELIEW